jgi:hypothetical protein
MQIVAGAILLGIATFFAIILFIVPGQRNGQGVAAPLGPPLMSILLVALLSVNVPLAFLIPGMQIRAALKRIATGTWRPPTPANPSAYSTDAAKLLAVRQTAMIINLAFLEGTAFFGCIAYLLEGQTFVLAVVVLVMALMVLIFPTQSRIRVWLEQQTDRLAELRQQAGFAGEP